MRKFWGFNNNVGRLGIFILATVWAGTPHAQTGLPRITNTAALQRVADATSRGLEKIRASTGLMQDALIFTGGLPRVEETLTTPTNLGLDILYQLEISSATEGSVESRAAADTKLLRIVDALERLPRDDKTGLFFGWYNAERLERAFPNLSSIDNLHLAVALWTLAEAHPQLGERARRMFSGMDFSIFYDDANGLLRGNFNLSPEGEWIPEDYFYSFFGSETRSLYILGYALGLFPAWQDDQAFLRSLRQLSFEVVREGTGELGRRTLHLWDGGAFQLFLPDLLISERHRSPSMAGFFRAFAQQAQNYASPQAQLLPALSASFSLTSDNRLQYRGKQGFLTETSRLNLGRELSPYRENWEATWTPHALFLLLEDGDPQLFTHSLELTQNLRDAQGLAFFDTERGFLDGWMWKSETTLLTPVQISLDQLMILMAIRRHQNTDQKLISARRLDANPEAQRRLQFAYENLEQLLQR